MEKEEYGQIDQALVERAQQGDTEAFGELIEKHRAQAHRIAQRITGDPHLADDIVQDALIRAFLHLGALADTSRFLPWLHRIVRNQANMRLRRGGPYKHERPFTSYGMDREQVDWDDLDSVLHHLTRSTKPTSEQDPEAHLLRKELYETIHALLHCLNQKERGMFEAYFFRQLAPEEIAAMFQTTTGSVYTYLHRSRLKLRKEQVRVALGLSQEKGRSLLRKSKVLELPPWPDSAVCRMSFVDRVGHMLAYVGDPRDGAELMGRSGFAFQMTISNRNTFADGLYMFDWRSKWTLFMKELGYDTSLLCGQLAGSPVPLLGAVERFPVVLPIEEAVLPFIRKYIELGKPLLYFDTAVSRPYIHEWTLVYGYDDEQRIVYVTDPIRPEGRTLTYDEVTDNPVRFLAAIDGKTSTGAGHTGQHSWKDALHQAVQLARSGSGYHPRTSYLSYTSGLAVYDRWIHHLSQGESAPPNRYGMGQLAWVYAGAKRQAAAYARTARLRGEAMRLALLAAEAYEQTAEALEGLSGMLPFARGVSALTLAECERCAEWLTKAKEFEAAATSYLEKALRTIDKETRP